MGKAVIYFFLNADKKDKKRFDILLRLCLNWNWPGVKDALVSKITPILPS
jgi:hypothetical protein